MQFRETTWINVANGIFMHKFVWIGTTISDDEEDGAWSQKCTNSGTERPPIIKVGRSTGPPPTLMGFGDVNF